MNRGQRPGDHSPEPNDNKERELHADDEAEVQTQNGLVAFLELTDPIPAHDLTWDPLDPWTSVELVAPQGETPKWSIKPNVPMIAVRGFIVRGRKAVWLDQDKTG